MGVRIEIALPGQATADTFALPVADPVSPLAGDGARIVDERLGGRLGRLAERGDVDTRPGRTVVLHLDGELSASRLVLAGAGSRDAVDAETLRAAAAAAGAEARRAGGSLLWLLDESLPLDTTAQAAALVEGTIVGAYDPGRWKTGEGPGKQLEAIVVGQQDEAGLRRAVERAAVVAEHVNRARDLANAPPNELSPDALASHAAALAEAHDYLSFEALGPAEIDRLGMGAFAAVARGSANEPRLIVLRYEPPAAPSSPLLGLVGKAITFDAGGISLKPARGMEDMKGDMAGGAGVIEGLGAIAELQVPVRAIAVVASCENLPGGAAFRPGDILTAANGKTIEITNTDAEGRLVLADALWYSRREGATHVVDLATLTGAMELALGDLYAGFFANDDEWAAGVLAAGEASGDLVTRFPLHPRYRRYVDSDFADMKNSSDLRQGSPALAAEFLHEFAGDGPWAHVDMAGPGFLERSRGDYLRVAGGTGWGVRLLTALAESLA
jgi:leucyl aminopeptidase